MQFDTFQVACHVAGDRRMVQDINGANVQNLEQASVLPQIRTETWF
jgi:hypothetical protein